MAAAATARRIARYVYLGLIGLFLFGILLQAYFAGRFIWGLESTIDLHAELGWPMSHMLAPIVLLLSFFLKGGKNFWIPSIVWGIVAYMQPLIAVWNEKGTSEVEALHPVTALILFGLTMWLAWRAWEMVSEPPARKPVMTSRPPAPAPSRPIAPPARR